MIGSLIRLNETYVSIRLLDDCPKSSFHALSGEGRNIFKIKNVGFILDSKEVVKNLYDESSKEIWIKILVKNRVGWAPRNLFKDII